jgi:CSLREA domain-containing protein
MERKTLTPEIILGCLLLWIPLLAGCAPSPTPLPCSTLSVTVTKTADTDDGACSAADCSLREAVIMTNTCPGQQEIRIPAGTYLLTIPGAGEDNAATGDLDILDYTMLYGIGNPVIDGNQLDRVFDVQAAAYVVLSGLTIRNGRSQYGAGIRTLGTTELNSVTVRDNTAAAPPGGGSSSGGGIFGEGFGIIIASQSLITANSADRGGGMAVTAHAMNGAITPGGGIWDTVVSENSAAEHGGGLDLDQTVGVSGFVVSRSQVTKNSAGSDGGGIRNAGKLTLYQSRIQENRTGEFGGGVRNLQPANLEAGESTMEKNAAKFGGGLYNEGQARFIQSALVNNQADGEGGGADNSGVNARLILENTTVSGNQAPAGGGLRNQDGGFQMNFVTLASNASDGIRHSGSGETWIRNSIVSANGGSNCTGQAPHSAGYNIDSGHACGFTQPSDLSDLDPKLYPLAIVGGLTPTHVLYADSPAIDSADPLQCLATDQRGVTRPQGAGCDRGAFEREAQVGAPTPAPSPQAPTLTLTPTSVSPQFLNRWISTDHVYFYGAECGPTEVQFQVQLTDADGVANVDLFVRLREKSSGKLGVWSGGIPMAPIGDNRFAAAVPAEDIPDVQNMGESWLQYQFVALDASGEAVVRSEVYGDVTVSRCGKRGVTSR